MTAKLDVGRVFEQIFRIYRQQFGLLIGGALAIYLPVAIVNGILYDAGGFFLTLIANAILLIAGYLYQGMVVEAARDILDGRRDQSIGGLFSSAGPVVGTLIVVGVLAGIAIAIGFVLLIIPGLFLLTIWAVIVPVVVIERTGVFDSFGRSRGLVKGNSWQVFGVLVLLFIATFVVQVLIAAILGGIFDSLVGFALGVLLTTLLMMPLTALAAAVLFFDLKMIKGEPVLASGPGGLPAEPSGPAAPAMAAPGEEAGPGGGTPAAPTTPERPATPDQPATPAHRPRPSRPRPPRPSSRLPRRRRQAQRRRSARPGPPPSAPPPRSGPPAGARARSERRCASPSRLESHPGRVPSRRRPRRRRTRRARNRCRGR